MVMKKSGRGSVGREFRRIKRFQEDEGYKRKRLEMQRVYYKNNREKNIQRHKKWSEELSKFANRRCKKCNKLLNWQTKGDYCRKHKWIGKKKKCRLNV